MAKALADVVGMTKRQVQFWSDHEVLHFLPGSGGTRGNQRLYPRTELPFAALAGALAANGVQIGTIKLAMDLVRRELNNPNLRRANPSKFRRWLRGGTGSYILVRAHPADGGGYKQSVTWVSEKDLKEKYLEWGHVTTVINVKRVMSSHAR